MTNWICFALSLVLIGVPSSSAQDILFQSDLSTDNGMVVLEGTDNAFEFGFGYDFEGIPEAPHSEALGGNPQEGLKMEANLTLGEAAELAAITDALQLSGRFMVQVDVWLNYAIPFGTSGTTEFGGLAVGHDGETAGRSGASLIYDTDGDSGSDYRLYRNTDFQTLDSGSYAVESLNNTSEPFASAFPPIDVEEAVPDQFIVGNTPAGSGGFRWMTLEAEVDTDAIGVGTTNDPGVVTFSLTDAATGNEVTVGTIDNSAGGAVVDLAGEVGLLYLDIFSSLSADENLSFGIFDNLIVTRLEPRFVPEDCNQDGAITADDLQCATLETLDSLLGQLNLLRGDLNGNGTVDFPDFLTLSQNFGSAVESYTSGDIDLDGTVAFADFLTLSQNFGMSVAAAAVVPEPATLPLWICGGLFVIRRRRREGRGD